MPFSDEKRNKLITYLLDRIGRIRPCPVCGQDTDFQMLNELVNLNFSDSVKLAIGNAYASHLVLICAKCGNTHLLNANVLKVMDILMEEETSVIPNDSGLSALFKGDPGVELR